MSLAYRFILCLAFEVYNKVILLFTSVYKGLMISARDLTSWRSGVLSKRAIQLVL